MLSRYIYLLRLPLQLVLPPRPRAAARALHAQTSSRHSKPHRVPAIRHRWDHQWTCLLAHCRAAPRCAATPALSFRLPHHLPL
ncbi:hypothetical protein T492DRAFT_1097293, partial [Pavlovales sp. CCMP2436]